MIFFTIQVWKTSFKKRFWRLSENIIRISARTYAFSIILKIYYKSFFIYLRIKKVVKVALKVKIGYVSNTKGWKNLSRFWSRKIDPKKVESYRFNI